MGLNKKKSGKALFEVITTYRQKHPGTGPLKPEWMRRREQPADAAMPQLTPEPMAPEASEPPPMRPIRMAAPPPTLEPMGESMVDQTYEAMVNTADGRLRLSFNYVTATVVALALVVMFVATFLLGRVSATAPAGKPMAATQPAEKGPVAQRPARPTEPARPKATFGLFADDLPRGKYYFVIQVIKDTTASDDEKKQEADRIARFCSGAPAGKAVPATRALYVMRNGSRMWLAIATEPFESSVETDRVKELEKRAEALGADRANPTLYKFKLEKTLVLLNEG